MLGDEGTLGVLKCLAEAGAGPVHWIGKAMHASRAVEEAVLGLLLPELCLRQGQQCPTEGQERVTMAFPWEECPGFPLTFPWE